MSIILCFSGGIASGKTTIAKAVAERLGVQSVGFGTFIRSEARSRGLAEDRDALQSLGESLIAEMGWPAFCHAVLKWGGWTHGASLVVEGVRHEAALEAIRGLAAPTRAILIFVEVPREIRQARVDGSRRGDVAELAEAETHSTEKDVHNGMLRGRADLILDGTRELHSVLDEVCRALGIR